MTPTPHTAHDAAARAAFVATPAGTTIPSDERDYAWDFLLSDQSDEVRAGRVSDPEEADHA